MFRYHLEDLRARTEYVDIPGTLFIRPIIVNIYLYMTTVMLDVIQPSYVRQKPTTLTCSANNTSETILQTALLYNS